MYFNNKGNIRYKDAGVDTVKNYCHRCHNDDRSLFYGYHSPLHEKKVKYCLNCISIGRSDSVTPLMAMETRFSKEVCEYRLHFELTEIQKAASERVVQAVRTRTNLLLHAVTGAGKTEIIFEGIRYARAHGLNVAVVSPRIDVVKEVHLRLSEAFKNSRIDLMFAGVKVKFEYHFTVCTVHQLYNFINHFDCIIVDEYDAFPLVDDRHLREAVNKAKTECASIIIMTATPTRKMLALTGRDNVFQITRRYHGHDLAIPGVHYADVQKGLGKKRLHPVLKRLLEEISENGRKVLVFFPEIKMMHEAHALISKYFDDAATVWSGDPERYLKVQRMRDGETWLLLTTTILERGVTFRDLDVIVVHTEHFPSDTLIQICGRVGRKPQDPRGSVHFLALYNTRHIRETVRKIKAFNSGRAEL